MENNNRTKIIIIALVCVVIVLLIAITLLSSFSQKRNDNNAENEVTNALQQNNGGTNNNAQLNKISPTSQSTMPIVTKTSSLRPTQSLKIPETFKSPQEAIDSSNTSNKTIIWTDTFKTSTGDYPFTALQCAFKTQGADCIKSKDIFPDSRVGITVMWAKFKNGNIFNIDQDLDLYLTRQFQIDFWHCRFLYEMSQSNLFNSTQKDKLKKYA